MPATIRAAVGRDALIPPHPAPPPTPRGWLRHCLAACRGLFHIGPALRRRERPRADMETAPATNGGARGHLENREPRRTPTPER